MENFDDVISFCGKGEDGMFGILANAERRIYSLKYGLAYFKNADGSIEYLALPGGILYFVSNNLSIATRNYVRSSEYREVNAILEQKIKAEEEMIGEIKRNLHEIDQEIIKRLSKLEPGWWQ